MSENLELFNQEQSYPKLKLSRPLAERLRPNEWQEFFGLDSLDKNLANYLRAGKGRVLSLLLWGPPGCGKTTLARLIGKSFDVNFVETSAVLVGVKEVRELVERAKRSPKPSLLFMDEIHRFNKAQQDAFLPSIEAGFISLIGATTENPSFYLNSALLSRMKLVTLKPLAEDALKQVAARALDELELRLEADGLASVLQFSAGDARRLLNLIESFPTGFVKGSLISKQAVEAFLKESKHLVYDRSEEHYNMASAFIKSMRGSDPDAALYWGLRMIESGDDPEFIIRRMIIFASEDIGNADPKALQVATATAQAFERVGLPEGKIPISQCITYLASAPKSNASYAAMKQVLQEIEANPKVEVPLHLRNAPTDLMKSLDYGKGYKYAHDFEGGVAPGQTYLPKNLLGKKFYRPG